MKLWKFHLRKKFNFFKYVTSATEQTINLHVIVE